MSLIFKSNLRVFVHRESIDLRAGFDRLSGLVVEKFNSQLVDGDLFIFFGKSRVKLKMIVFDGTGVVLINKRLERGKFMSISDLEVSEITSEEFQALIHGGIVRRPIYGEIPLTKLPYASKSFFQDGIHC